MMVAPFCVAALMQRPSVIKTSNQKPKAPESNFFIRMCSIPLPKAHTMTRMKNDTLLDRLAYPGMN